MNLVVDASIKSLVSIDVNDKDKLGILVGEVNGDLIIDYIASVKLLPDSFKVSITADGLFHQHHNILIPKRNITSYSLMNFRIIPEYKKFLNNVGITLNVIYDEKEINENETPLVLH